MPVVEMLIHPRGELIGRIVTVHTPGVLITPAEYIDWIDNDVDPPSWSALNRPLRIRKLRRWALERRYYIDQAFDHDTCSRTRWGDYDVVTQRQRDRYDRITINDKARHDSRDAIHRVEGLDTNWGRRDSLRSGLILADLNRGRLELINEDYSDSRVQPPRDEVQNSQSKQKEFRMRQNAISPALLARWQDVDDNVPIDRGMIPLTWANFERFPDAILEP